MQDVKDWLESEERDYSVGLILLGNHSKNRILLQNLSRKPRPSKLVYELEKICLREKVHFNKTNTPIFLSTPVNNIQKVVRKNPFILYNELPEHMRELRKENLERYKKARSLHEKCKLLNTPEERVPLLEQLEELTKIISGNWDIINEYLEEKAKPREGEVVIIDDKKIQANRTYLSRGLASMATLKGAARAKKIEAMQKRVNELLSVKSEFTEDYIKQLKEIGIHFNE